MNFIWNSHFLFEVKYLYLIVSILSQRLNPRIIFLRAHNSYPIFLNFEFVFSGVIKFRILIFFTFWKIYLRMMADVNNTMYLSSYIDFEWEISWNNNFFFDESKNESFLILSIYYFQTSNSNFSHFRCTTATCWSRFQSGLLCYCELKIGHFKMILPYFQVKRMHIIWRKNPVHNLEHKLKIRRSETETEDQFTIG